MRKVLLVIALSLGLAGCANLKAAFDALTTVSASFSNPVTPTMLYNMENGVIVVFSGLRAYRQSCIQGAIPPSCRDVIVRLQAYTRRLPAMLTDLRAYVRNNDQVNAVVVYNTALKVIADLKSEAASSNVPTGGN